MQNCCSTAGLWISVLLICYAAAQTTTKFYETLNRLKMMILFQILSKLSTIRLKINLLFRFLGDILDLDKSDSVGRNSDRSEVAFDLGEIVVVVDGENFMVGIAT